MQRSSAGEPPQRKVWRKVLRALNGAGIGAVAGGLLGASLAVVSATILEIASGGSWSYDRWTREWGIYAFLGALPGVPTGFLLGPTILIRSDRKRVFTGTVFGLLVGLVYSECWKGALQGQWAVLSSIWISGAVGGAVLTLIFTAIRHYWSWWTRWEDQDFSSSAVTEAGGNVTG